MGLARVLALFFYPHSYLRGRRGHAASLTPTLTAFRMHLTLSSSFINHLRRADLSLSNNYAASKSFLFIVSDKTRCSTSICNDARVRPIEFTAPKMHFVRDLDTAVNATSRPLEELYSQFSPRYENITLAYWARDHCNARFFCARVVSCSKMQENLSDYLRNG